MGLHQSRRHRIDDSNQIGPLAIDVGQLEQDIFNAYAKGLADARQDTRELAKDIAIGLEQARHEHAPLPLRVTHRPPRELDYRVDSLQMDDLETDDGFEDRVRYVVRTRRGPVGGLRRRGAEHVPGGDIDVDAEIYRRVRDQNESVSRRGRPVLREQVVGSLPRRLSFERMSPLSSDDGRMSPGFDRRRRPPAPMPRG
jgi:hypothetical protein